MLILDKVCLRHVPVPTMMAMEVSHTRSTRDTCQPIRGEHSDHVTSGELWLVTWLQEK